MIQGNLTGTSIAGQSGPGSNSIERGFFTLLVSSIMIRCSLVWTCTCWNKCMLCGWFACLLMLLWIWIVCFWVSLCMRVCGFFQCSVEWGFFFYFILNPEGGKEEEEEEERTNYPGLYVRPTHSICQLKSRQTYSTNVQFALATNTNFHYVFLTPSLSLSLSLYCLFFFWWWVLLAFSFAFLHSGHLCFYLFIASVSFLPSFCILCNNHKHIFFFAPLHFIYTHLSFTLYFTWRRSLLEKSIITCGAYRKLIKCWGIA